MTRTADRPRIAIGLSAVFLAVFLNVPSAAFAQPRIFSPESAPFGQPFSQWSAQWWQFVLSLPAAGNPLFDQTGELCVSGQRGPVWFLMGTGGGAVARSCSIPEDKALFFPVINVVDVNTTHQTAADLRAEVAPCLDGVTNLSVELDGRSIQQRGDRFRVRSDVFDVTLPNHSLFEPAGLTAGIYSPAVDDGFYMMLKPLPSGQHVLHFSASSVSATCGSFSLDVTYYLSIIPVDLHEEDSN